MMIINSLMWERGTHYTAFRIPPQTVFFFLFQLTDWLSLRVMMIIYEWIPLQVVRSSDLKEKFKKTFIRFEDVIWIRIIKRWCFHHSLQAHLMLSKASAQHRCNMFYDDVLFGVFCVCGLAADRSTNQPIDQQLQNSKYKLN